MSRSADEGMVEAVPLALLTFVVGVLVLSHAWAVITTRGEAATAARAAVRAYVEADAPDARSAALTAGRRALAQVDGRNGRWDIILSASGGRCRPVTARVTTSVPLMQLPWLGATGVISVSAAHSEIVDPFRRGLHGVADCRV